jgi:hypothetical protein
MADVETHKEDEQLDVARDEEGNDEVRFPIHSSTCKMLGEIQAYTHSFYRKRYKR